MSKRIKIWILLSAIIPLFSACEYELVHELFVINNTDQEIDMWIYEQFDSGSYISDSLIIDSIGRSLQYIQLLPNNQHKIYHNFQRTSIDGLESCIIKDDSMWFDSTGFIVAKDINSEFNWQMDIEHELRFNRGGIVNCYFTIDPCDIKY